MTTEKPTLEEYLTDLGVFRHYDDITREAIIVKSDNGVERAYTVVISRAEISPDLRPFLKETEFADAYTMRVYLNRAPEYAGIDAAARLEVLTGQAAAGKFGLKLSEDKHQVLVATVASKADVTKVLDVVKAYAGAITSGFFAEAVRLAKEAEDNFQKRLEASL